MGVAARDGRGRGGGLRPQSNGVRQLSRYVANTFDIKDTAVVFKSAEIVRTITIPTRVGIGLASAGPCHNRHNNHESLAPRCKIKNPENDVDGIGMDYCTACEGAGCPDAKSAPTDERPGNEVGQISWLPGEIKPAEEESDRSQDYYNYDYDNYDLD